MDSNVSNMNNYGLEIQTAIAEVLRAERAIAGMTQAEMAERAGMTEQTVGRYLRGTRDIPLFALASMCKGLGLSMSAVIDQAEQRLAKKQNGQ